MKFNAIVDFVMETTIQSYQLNLAVKKNLVLSDIKFEQNFLWWGTYDSAITFQLKITDGSCNNSMFFVQFMVMTYSEMFRWHLEVDNGLTIGLLDTGIIHKKELSIELVVEILERCLNQIQ